MNQFQHLNLRIKRIRLRLNKTTMSTRKYLLSSNIWSERPKKFIWLALLLIGRIKFWWSKGKIKKKIYFLPNQKWNRLFQKWWWLCNHCWSARRRTSIQVCSRRQMGTWSQSSKRLNNNKILKNIFTKNVSISPRQWSMTTSMARTILSLWKRVILRWWTR